MKKSGKNIEKARKAIEARPYTLLSTTLTTTSTSFSAAVPPFDPLKTVGDRTGKSEPQKIRKAASGPRLRRASSARTPAKARSAAGKSHCHHECGSIRHRGSRYFSKTASETS